MNTRMALAASWSVILTSGLLATAANAQTAQLTSSTANTLAAASFDRGLPTDHRFDASAHVQQGFDLIRKGKQAQAVKLFDKVIQDADQRLVGDMRPRQCSTTGAIASDSAIVDSAVCDAHFGKGYALIDMGRGDLAETELRTAAQMAPTNAHFTNEYAELFKSRREWQQSYDLFAHAWDVVDKNPKGADAGVAARALRGMGYNKIELGQYEEAERLFKQSQIYDPTSTVASGELEYIARKKAIGA
ncbi:diguanylate cyclase/phosphodiesterase [Novosphingobium sp. Rr 2-17]|uniref:tetratricopeptide repeat protein n=1 Tax=Novosphingobium sp. Rr 2-17 TaxID=555793 RepID=UPI00026998A3|nr:diguanylate cyclase [Novosphingobium sp. Rr 2-17]EIZ78786.1 diguanylate cyclase/phosphodiesterase [Novosphingobium sp. Rr 2-17]